MDPCEDLERVLFNAELTRSERIAAIGELADVEACIADGLSSTAAEGAWGRFERWLLAASERPSLALTPLLCKVLTSRLPEVNNEDLVEVLGEIGDLRAIGAIEDALLWNPDWDEFHALGVKCVWALGAIASQEARSILENAASVGPEEVRSAAKLELRRLDDG